MSSLKDEALPLVIHLTPDRSDPGFVVRPAHKRESDQKKRKKTDPDYPLYAGCLGASNRGPVFSEEAPCLRAEARKFYETQAALGNIRREDLDKRVEAVMTILARADVQNIRLTGSLWNRETKERKAANGISDLILEFDQNARKDLFPRPSQEALKKEDRKVEIGLHLGFDLENQEKDLRSQSFDCQIWIDDPMTFARNPYPSEGKDKKKQDLFLVPTRSITKHDWDCREETTDSFYKVLLGLPKERALKLNYEAQMEWLFPKNQPPAVPGEIKFKASNKVDFLEPFVAAQLPAAIKEEGPLPQAVLEKGQAMEAEMSIKAAELEAEIEREMAPPVIDIQATVDRLVAQQEERNKEEDAVFDASQNIRDKARARILPQLQALEVERYRFPHDFQFARDYTNSVVKKIRALEGELQLIDWVLEGEERAKLKAISDRYKTKD